MSIRREKIYISLSYSPKATTLQKKFGNLPVKYLRTKLENEEELQIFEKALKRFRFNIEDVQEAIEDGDVITVSPAATPSKKLCLKPPPQPSTRTTAETTVSREEDVILIDDEEDNIMSQLSQDFV